MDIMFRLWTQQQHFIPRDHQVQTRRGNREKDYCLCCWQETTCPDV